MIPRDRPPGCPQACPFLNDEEPTTCWWAAGGNSVSVYQTTGTAAANNYINPAAFSLAPQGTFGDTPRAIGLRGPAKSTGMFRSSRISPYYYSPNTKLSSGTFGQITGQANFSRQLQLAARLTFY